MNKITVSSGENGVGYLHFDFDEKHIVFDRQSAQSFLQVDFNKKVKFSEITGIELKKPGMIGGGRAVFIINNIRYKSKSFCTFDFFVNKANFANLNLAINQLSNEIGVSIKSINEYSATVKEYSGEYTIFDSDESNNLTNTERRKRCNACGKIICYNLKDVEDNQRRAKSAALSAVGGMAGALSGNYAAGATSNQTAADELNRIIDYTKCPSCGSRDLVDITDEDIAKINAQQNGQPAISSADELKKFKELLDMGAITQEEFDQKKKQLLGL